MMRRLKAIDSHTAGEPTRIVVEGWPDLGSGPLAERRRLVDGEFDRYRSAAVNEPRGSDVIVGAVLVPPLDPGAVAGVIFFNNVGTLGMCGHGTIGLMATLAHMGRIRPGAHRIETPVGTINATLHEDGAVTVTNVPSWRAHRDVPVDVPGVGVVRGDVAWGGNWFFLMKEHGQALDLGAVETLTDYAWRVRQAVNSQGFPEVDHVELFGPGAASGADSKNFVLCPGKAYDRSPCGTGTSAKLACLAADGELDEGEEWVQESIIGSMFRGSYQWADRGAGHVVPSVTGRAFVTAETTLILDERDKLCWGIRP